MLRRFRSGVPEPKMPQHRSSRNIRAGIVQGSFDFPPREVLRDFTEWGTRHSIKSRNISVPLRLSLSGLRVSSRTRRVVNLDFSYYLVAGLIRWEINLK